MVLAAAAVFPAGGPGPGEEGQGGGGRGAGRGRLPQDGGEQQPARTGPIGGKYSCVRMMKSLKILRSFNCIIDCCLLKFHLNLYPLFQTSISLCHTEF